jgi:hypothetical protein
MSEANPEFAEIMQKMLDEWNASNEALRAKLLHMSSELARVADLTLLIKHKNRELEHRRNAAHQLHGVPKRHNDDAIDTLYDAITALSVERDVL